METIRIAQFEDCAAIAHVHVESWRTTYQDFVPVEHHPSYDQRLHMWQQVLSTSSSEGLTLVAVNEQGQLVGFVNSGSRTRYDDLEYEIELTAIYLLEGAQGHGLGRRLVRAFVEQLLQVEHHSMLLWVFAQNHAACHFYESLGGIRIKTARFPLGGTSYEVVAYGWRDISVLK
jgi:L-amino acid N-acyltransferase YncA